MAAQQSVYLQFLGPPTLIFAPEKVIPTIQSLCIHCVQRRIQDFLGGAQGQAHPDVY